MNEPTNASQDSAGQDIAELAQRLRAARPDYPAERFSGQGVVICAGGPSVFTNAYVLVSILRRTLGSTLPIEVWHFGAGEMSESMAALLSELGVELVDALPRIAHENADIHDGWQLKPFAIQHSRFAEVLLLDSDQVPVRDPAEVFAWPEYLETGAVFWPDIIELRENNPVWAALELTPRRTVSFESGQVLVDKRRHWRAISLVTALNVEARQLYEMIYGDKDTFLVGWQLAEAALSLVPHTPFIDERCLIQRDFSGMPLFQHRTNCKWTYAGSQYDIEGFVHFEAAKAALKELRARWNGRVFNPPDRSAAARAMESELVEGGALLLEVIADETMRIELLPRGEFALTGGRANDRLNWWCEDGPDGLCFVIADADRVTYRLRRLDRNNWEGMRLRVPEHAVAMRRPLAVEPTPGSAPGLVDELLAASGFPGASAEAEAELLAALRLLSRIDAGVVARLHFLASRSPELAALVGERGREWERGEVQRGMILNRFYHFTGRDD